MWTNFVLIVDLILMWGIERLNKVEVISKLVNGIPRNFRNIEKLSQLSIKINIKQCKLKLYAFFMIAKYYNYSTFFFIEFLIDPIIFHLPLSSNVLKYVRKQKLWIIFCNWNLHSLWGFCFLFIRFNSINCIMYMSLSLFIVH